MVHDDSGDPFYWDAHVFGALHGSVQVEVFDIGADHASVGSRKGAVDLHFEESDVGSGCMGVTRVVDEIAANS